MAADRPTGIGHRVAAKGAKLHIKRTLPGRRVFQYGSLRRPGRQSGASPGATSSPTPRDMLHHNPRHCHRQVRKAGSAPRPMVPAAICPVLIAKLSGVTAEFDFLGNFIERDPEPIGDHRATDPPRERRNACRIGAELKSSGLVAKAVKPRTAFPCHHRRRNSIISWTRNMVNPAGDRG